MKWLLIAVASLPLLGCAAKRQPLPSEVIFRHMTCQKDPEADSPSIAVCHCRNPYWALNAKTRATEVMCQK